MGIPFRFYLYQVIYWETPRSALSRPETGISVTCLDQRDIADFRQQRNITGAGRSCSDTLLLRTAR